MDWKIYKNKLVKLVSEDSTEYIGRLVYCDKDIYYIETSENPSIIDSVMIKNTYINFLKEPDKIEYKNSFELKMKEFRNSGIIIHNLELTKH